MLKTRYSGFNHVDENLHPDGGYPDSWFPLIGKNYANDPAYQLWLTRMQGGAESSSETQVEGIPKSQLPSGKRPRLSVRQQSAVKDVPLAGGGGANTKTDTRLLAGFPQISAQNVINENNENDNAEAGMSGIAALPPWAWILLAFLALYAITQYGKT